MKSQARLRLRKPKRTIELTWVGSIPKNCVRCGGDRFANTGNVYKNTPVYQCLGCARCYVNA